MTHAGIRQRLTKLEPDLTDGEWQGLLKRGYVEDVTTEAETIEWLARELRGFRRDFGRAHAEQRETAGPMLGREPRLQRRDRMLALSILFGEDATTFCLDDRPELGNPVVEFRHQVLQGRLLDGSEVEGWIRAQAQADGLPAQWPPVGVPPPPGATTLLGPRGATIGLRSHPIDAGGELLAYGVPGDAWVHYVPTVRGGVLHALLEISKGLEIRYGWRQAQATVFVLTKSVPRVDAIRAQTHLSGPITAASRLVLTIDPLTTPREVAAYYAKVRRRTLAGGRHRPMSEKHLKLAIFAARRPPGETWAARMGAWNAEHPNWRYRNDAARTFCRDCRQAQRRLLYPGYQWTPRNFIPKLIPKPTNKGG